MKLNLVGVVKVLVQQESKLSNMTYSISEEKIERYSRNILLPEIAGLGQEKLLKSKVMVVGAGGLGSPVIMYLSAVLKICPALSSSLYSPSQ